MKNAESSAAALYDTLCQLGVRHLFGLDEPVALLSQMDTAVMKQVTVRDERNAAIMADGYARVSGRPGVCAGCQGPGATNLVHGLIEAYFASSPVVALANDFRLAERGRNQSQAVDMLQFFRPITKSAIRVEEPERVSEVTKRSFYQAVTGRPGPVFVAYPHDVMDTTPRSVPVVEASAARYPAARVAPDPESVRKVIPILANAKRPVVVAGGGVLISHAEAELALLAEKLQAPVATTQLGKGAFDETHPLSAGTSGGYTGGRGGRGVVANELITEADVVLLIGSKTDGISTNEWTVPPQESTIIHLDVDPVEIGRNYPESIPVIGDAVLGIRALLAGLEETPARTTSWADEKLRTGFKAWEEDATPLLQSDAQPIRPERLYAEMARVIDDNTIVATDASYCSAWAMELLKFRRPGRRILMPRGFASLGWGLPLAIGAQFASPDSTVLCLTGDGGFGYVSHELETAARYSLPIVIVVLNNRTLAFQKHYEEEFWGRTIETEFLDVDHAGLARALGCSGVRITDPSDFKAALHDAIASKRPTLIDVVTDVDALPALSLFHGSMLDPATQLVRQRVSPTA